MQENQNATEKTSFPQELKWLMRAIKFTRPYRWQLTAVLFMTFIVAGSNAVVPLVMKFIFDSLTQGDGFSLVFYWAAVLALLALLREVISGFSNWLSWRTRISIHYGLLDNMVERIHRVPQLSKESEGVGAIMTRLDRSIQGFIGAISELSFNLIPALSYLIFAIAVMIRLDTRLTLLVLFFAPLPAIIAAFAAPTQIRRERSLLDRWAKIYSRFNEVLSGIVTVRSFAMEDEEKKRFLGDVGKANKVVTKGVKFDSAVGALQNLVITFANIAAIGVGGYLIVAGEITIGTLVAFLGYVGGLFGPVQGLTGIYRTLRTASVSLDQVFTILDAQDSLGDAPDAIDAGVLKGRVNFENVHFSYENSCETILEGIDLDVQEGENIAIVGPSGAGKSTMMALLQRFYDPVEGRVTIDGMDLKILKQKSVRSQIGVVLQDALLFNDTIRNNIAYGRPGASMDDIESAARAANAHDFIVRMEKNYNTIVGERGNRLSFGERQRIAIARAILTDPPVMILDEATSALDAEIEALVQEALERLIKGRTTFVIAHRLATVVKANRIIVLKNGTIIASGTHRELLEQDGYYASLVRRQTKGLILAESA